MTPALRITRLAASDALNIARDPVLVFAIVLSVLPALAIALLGDAIDTAVEGAFGVTGITRLIAPMALVLPAALIGWVGGFLLIEDRDDNVLPAVEVTPPGKAGYLAYRAGFVAAAVFVVTAFSVAAILPGIGTPVGAAIAALAACEGVTVAALLPALARNKVEGLALTKLMNLASIVPLAALLPSTWRYVFGVIPAFWIGEIVIGGTPLAIALAFAVATHVAAAAGAFWLFARRTA